MKLSVLGQIYDQIAQAGSDSRRVRILTDLFRHLDGQTLEAAAHLTMGELIKPQMTDRLGIGPGEIEDEVKKTG